MLAVSSGSFFGLAFDLVAESWKGARVGVFFVLFVGFCRFLSVDGASAVVLLFSGLLRLFYKFIQLNRCRIDPTWA